MTKKKKIMLGMAGVLIIGLLAGGLFIISHYVKIKNDFERLEQEEYDTVFFSMYPTENYEEGDYTHFRAMQIVKTDYVIPDSRILGKYMDKVNETCQPVSTVYLGIDPTKIRIEDVVAMIQENPEIQFEIVPAYPQITYWTDMSDAEYEEVYGQYLTFAEWMMAMPNARTYLFTGCEWLICNRENYVNTFSTNPEVSQFLMCNSDNQHPYMVEAHTIHTIFQEMRQLLDSYREKPAEYPDGSGYDIVFLGDSIIGNHTDSLSIPGVVKALTGAEVYNCGYPGKSAALGETNPLPLPGIADAIVSGKLSEIPRETLVYEGVNSFLEREEKDKQLMFVINYGLNDYFNGYPVRTADPRDISSYSGALRVTVKSIREAYPGAVILLMTPTFTVQFQYGSGVQSEVGGVLADYVDAVLEFEKEAGVKVLDNFNGLPIAKENHFDYLVDGTHMTEQCRFIVGSRIAELVE